MPEETMSRPGRTTLYVVSLIAILVGIALVGLRLTENRATAWSLVLILLTAFLVITGKAVTGHWKGILIDSRNRMSLSRLQFLTWSLIALSAILMAAMVNLALEWDSPLTFGIPGELLVLMGISTASLVASPAVLSSKSTKKANQKELEDTGETLRKQGYEGINTRAESLVVRNKDASEARWADLVKGDEAGDAATVDLGKLQMFFFTFVLVLAYGATVARLFANVVEPITSLPPIQEGMNVLLGISHSGYLANKAVLHNPKGSSQDRDEGETETRDRPEKRGAK